MSRSKCVGSLATIMLLCTIVAAHGQLSTNTHLIISEIATAGSPRVVDSFVLYTYEPDHPVRHVGVAFAHESFQRVWNLSRNDHGIYFALVRPQADTERILYRYVVDGLWMLDPSNRDSYSEPFEATLSSFRPEGLFQAARVSPRIDDSGDTEFYFHGSPGRLVYLTGDFSNWDPYLYRLTEIEEGVHLFRLPLPPGLYVYQFILDGRPVRDPLNASTVNRESSTASILVVRE